MTSAPHRTTERRIPQGSVPAHTDVPSAVKAEVKVFKADEDGEQGISARTRARTGSVGKPKLEVKSPHIKPEPPKGRNNNSNGSSAMQMSPKALPELSPIAVTPLGERLALMDFGETKEKEKEKEDTKTESKTTKRMSMKNEEHIEAMDQESEDGNIEYKWKLIGKSPERIAHLVTQMNYRLKEGLGEAIYELGIQDDGTPRGLSDDELAASINTIKLMASQLKCDVVVLRIAQGKQGKVAEVLVRKLSFKDFMDIRICVLGNVDAGKSTLVGVLTNGALDDGRGLARTNIFRHRHEVESGRSSSISRHILGFDSQGNCTNWTDKGSVRTRGWQEIVEDSSKIITFLDLAGHESYLKTTLYGLTGQLPDYGMLTVAANNGVLRMTKEHLGLSLTLRIPIFIVVTKIDMCPPNILQQTITQLTEILQQPDINKTPVVIKHSRDVLPIMANKQLTATSQSLCPIFLVSSVSGKGLKPLKMFLNLLPKQKDWSKFADEPAEFSVDDSYSVEGVGTVVTGMVMKGTIAIDDELLLGPSSIGEFTLVKIKGVHVKRTPTKRAVAGQAASLALKKVKRAHVRKGMALLHPSLKPRACIGFDAKVQILHHPTTIQAKYEPVLHCGTITQSAQLITADPEVLRKGDKAAVRFNFCHRPEYMQLGSVFVFREGRTKGAGKVTKLYFYDEDRDWFTNRRKRKGEKRPSLGGSESKATTGQSSTGTSGTQPTEKTETKVAPKKRKEPAEPRKDGDTSSTSSESDTDDKSQLNLMSPKSGDELTSPSSNISNNSTSSSSMNLTKDKQQSRPSSAGKNSNASTSRSSSNNSLYSFAPAPGFSVDTNLGFNKSFAFNSRDDEDSDEESPVDEDDGPMFGGVNFGPSPAMNPMGSSGLLVSSGSSSSVFSLDSSSKDKDGKQDKQGQSNNNNNNSNSSSSAMDLKDGKDSKQPSLSLLAAIQGPAQPMEGKPSRRQYRRQKREKKAKTGAGPKDKDAANAQQSQSQTQPQKPLFAPAPIKGQNPRAVHKPKEKKDWKLEKEKETAEPKKGDPLPSQSQSQPGKGKPPRPPKIQTKPQSQSQPESPSSSNLNLMADSPSYNSNDGENNEGDDMNLFSDEPAAASQTTKSKAKPKSKGKDKNSMMMTESPKHRTSGNKKKATPSTPSAEMDVTGDETSDAMSPKSTNSNSASHKSKSKSIPQPETGDDDASSSPAPTVSKNKAARKADRDKPRRGPNASKNLFELYLQQQQQNSN